MAENRMDVLNAKALEMKSEFIAWAREQGLVSDTEEITVRVHLWASEEARRSYGIAALSAESLLLNPEEFMREIMGFV